MVMVVLKYTYTDIKRPKIKKPLTKILKGTARLIDGFLGVYSYEKNCL